ncbi:MAG: phosphate/phosphite/phosphonate ABC transporter substrate-binding protein [Chloroflexi bacterium]|nr:phosphate/phosphite/phosphonate ABC transporter substrate-binding protein [Chloroflexota bacterium]
MYRKSVFKSIALLLLAVLILATPQPVQSAGKGKAPISLYIAYNSNNIPYAEYFAAARQLGQMIEEKMGRNVVVKVPHGDWVTSHDKVIKAIQRDKADMAWLMWSAYMVTHDTANAQIAINPVYTGQTYYQAQILTHDQAGILDLADIEGRSICWVDPLSVSGYVIPSLMLMAANVTPEADPQFIGSHQGVVRVLYERQCDAGATFVDAREGLLEEFPDIYTVVPVVADSPPIPHNGFAFAEDFPADQKDVIVQALVEISETEEGLELLKVITGPAIDRLTPVDHSIYSGMDTLFMEAGLTAEQVWETYYH